jgi:hypothetical protein
LMARMQAAAESHRAMDERAAAMESVRTHLDRGVASARAVLQSLVCFSLPHLPLRGERSPQPAVVRGPSTKRPDGDAGSVDSGLWSLSPDRDSPEPDATRRPQLGGEDDAAAMQSVRRELGRVQGLCERFAAAARAASHDLQARQLRAATEDAALTTRHEAVAAAEAQLHTLRLELQAHVARLAEADAAAASKAAAADAVLARQEEVGQWAAAVGAQQAALAEREAALSRRDEAIATREAQAAAADAAAHARLAEAEDALAALTAQRDAEQRAAAADHAVSGSLTCCLATVMPPELLLASCTLSCHHHRCRRLAMPRGQTWPAIERPPAPQLRRRVSVRPPCQQLSWR